MSIELAHRIQFEIPAEIVNVKPATNGISVSRDKVIRMIAHTDIPDILARNYLGQIAKRSKTPLGDCLVSFYLEWVKHYDPDGIEPENVFLPNSEHVVRFLTSPDWCELGDRKTHYVKMVTLKDAYSQYAGRHSLDVLSRNRFNKIVSSLPVRRLVNVGRGAETGTGCAVFRGVRLTEL